MSDAGFGTVLVVESATARGSVALLRDRRVAASADFLARDPVTGARTEGVAPAIVQCMASAGCAPADLDAIVCGSGPGGFTSLRCAAAVAKGMCSALAIPLYAVSSLELLANSAGLVAGNNYVAVLSAGRGEWFASVVRRDESGRPHYSAASLLSESELQDLVSMNSARLVGPGMDIDVYPRADAVLGLLARIEDEGPVSLDAWEPDYGRLAEAQVKWESAHGRPLPV